MIKVSIDLTEEAHIRLLEIQLERKKKKQEPSAINKIASEILNDFLGKEKSEK